MSRLNWRTSSVGMVALFFVVGCSGDNADQRLVGNWQSGEGKTSLSMKISDDGTLTMSIPTGSFDGNWKLDGDDFIMTVGGMEVHYRIETLDDANLVLGSTAGAVLPGMGPRKWRRVSTDDAAARKLSDETN